MLCHLFYVHLCPSLELSCLGLAEFCIFYDTLLDGTSKVANKGGGVTSAKQVIPIFMGSQLCVDGFMQFDLLFQDLFLCELSFEPVLFLFFLLLFELLL